MPDLKTRTMGLTGMRPKALGLGCAYFGTKDVTDDEAVEGIRHAIELGLNFIDTSPLYGQSERRVGLALAGGVKLMVDPRQLSRFYGLQSASLDRGWPA